MQIKKIVILFLIVSSSCNAQKYRDFNDTIILEISQTLVEPEYIFKINNDKLFIFKNKYLYKKGDIQVKEKIIFRKKLSKICIDNIKDQLEKLKFVDTKYIKSMLGGIHWDIFFTLDNYEKKIHIENTRVKEIDDLFKMINDLIPANKPRIVMN